MVTLDIIRALTAILTLPRSAEGVDALAVLTGKGEHWRLTHGVRAWEADPGLRHLLIAEGNPAERTYPSLDPDALHAAGLRRVEGVCVQPMPAPNTGLQAQWVADRVEALGIGGLGLVVSPYHLPRAYLTVLKALLQRGLRIPLLPVPAAVPLHEPVPESGRTAYELLPGEIERIVAYTDRGWLASLPELQEYLHWLWHSSGTLRR